MASTFTLTGTLTHQDGVTPVANSGVNVKAAPYPDPTLKVLYTRGVNFATDANGAFSKSLVTAAGLYYTIRSTARTPLFQPIVFAAPAAGTTVDLSSLTTYDPTGYIPNVYLDTIAAKNAAVAAAAGVQTNNWAASTAYVVGQTVRAPDGSTIKRLTSGTSRASFDTTEQALWNPVLSWDGTMEQSRTIPTINVRGAGYGAKGDGTTDDTTALQAAIDGATAFSGGSPVQVYLPSGTYMLSGKLTLKTNVRLCGVGQEATIIKSTAGAATNPLIDATGTGNMAIEHLTIDVNNRTNSTGFSFNPGGNNTTVGTGYRASYVTVKNSPNTCMRTAGQASNVLIENCLWDTCTIGCQFYPVTGQVNRNYTVRSCTWNNVGTNNLQFVGQNQGEFENVLILGNTQRNYQNVGANGPIPMELWGIDNLRILGNTCVGGGVGTRGIGFAKCRNVTMTGNTITGMTTYGSEISNNSYFTISGNVYRDCREWIDATAACSDGVISNNVFTGTGSSVLVAGLAGIRFDAASGTRIKITNNEFYNWPYLQSAVKFGVTIATDCEVTGNTFIVDDANSGVTAVNVRRGARVNISRNIVKINRNLATPGGTFDDDNSDVIQITLDSLSTEIAVVDNDFTYTGTFGTVAFHAAIGHGSTGTAAFPPGLVVRRNRVKNGVRGLRLGSVNLADQIIEDNDTRTCLSPDLLASVLVYRRTVRLMEATAAPTTGTWAKGDRVFNLSPAVGSPKGWVCTVAGTPGTWVSEGNL